MFPSTLLSLLFLLLSAHIHLHSVTITALYGVRPPSSSATYGLLTWAMFGEYLYPSSCCTRINVALPQTVRFNKIDQRHDCSELDGSPNNGTLDGLISNRKQQTLIKDGCRKSCYIIIFDRKSAKCR
ncbi:hypothetical protein BCR43DRAFT_307725 [Syncephalastrum racemosum]|uniref:Uncharacterized protein n=1 Tax=Syncephalastrum racemosum TaxID=13706 RepID=A0A1X2HAE0_SYNRA|nr:hypothetical protein BCR43DRAFT_307725 [Syncephalastrum racemosum]